MKRYGLSRIGKVVGVVCVVLLGSTGLTTAQQDEIERAAQLQHCPRLTKAAMASDPEETRRFAMGQPVSLYAIRMNARFHT